MLSNLHGIKASFHIMNICKRLQSPASLCILLYHRACPMLCPFPRDDKHEVADAMRIFAQRFSITCASKVTLIL